MTLEERFVQIVTEEPGLGTLEIRRRLKREGFDTRGGKFWWADVNLSADGVLKKTKKKNGYQWWPPD